MCTTAFGYPGISTLPLFGSFGAAPAFYKGWIFSSKSVFLLHNHCQFKVRIWPPGICKVSSRLLKQATVYQPQFLVGHIPVTGDMLIIETGRWGGRPGGTCSSEVEAERAGAQGYLGYAVNLRPVWATQGLSLKQLRTKILSFFNQSVVVLLLTVIHLISP